MKRTASSAPRSHHQRVSVGKLALVGLFLPLVIGGTIWFASAAFEGFDALGFVVFFGPIILALYLFLLTLGWLKMRLSVVLLGLIIFVAFIFAAQAITSGIGNIFEDDASNIFADLPGYVFSWVSLAALFVGAFWVSDFAYGVALQKTAERSRAALWMFALGCTVLGLLIVSFRIGSSMSEKQRQRDYEYMWQRTEEAFLESSEPVFVPLSSFDGTLTVTTDPEWRNAYITDIKTGHYLKTASMYQYSDATRAYKEEGYNGRIGNFWYSQDKAKNCRPLQGDIEKCDDNLYARRIVHNGTTITVLLEASQRWPYEELVEVPDKREVFAINILSDLEPVPARDIVTHPRYMDGFRLKP